jgi:predicted phosphodiesterase
MRTRAIFYRIVGYLLLGAISASTQELTRVQPAATQAAPAVSSAQLPASASQLDLRLPLQPKSVRFAVVGDTGTGGSAQYEIAKEMEAYRKLVGFDFVIMLGDNIYGGDSPKNFVRKFELPYKPLLDAGVKFYASLGNHDNPNERLYKLFNMGGERYYTFKKNDVAFFALDSNYMDPQQLSWLAQRLRDSNAAWKIGYFHHPLFNGGKHHGPDVDLRSLVAPLFEKYAVNVVFSGHEHVYERLKPVHGIYYFILGNSGQLMTHDLRKSDAVQVGFDSDRSFMIVEIAGDKLYFQTISRGGQTIDSDVLPRGQ